MISTTRTALATTPLDRLAIISVDLETTGLRTGSDRIVQIGAVIPDDPSHKIDQLVHPGISIPEKSTAIHHITNSDIEGAPAFPVAFSALHKMMKDRVVIGYNIGFDLAVIAAEARRYGVEWQIQPALCVRQLATVLLGRDQMLMIGTLEALAEYYGLPAENRHTALGDAQITAHLFHRILEGLNRKGIVTLGDAWRAVSLLDDQRAATTKAGWVDVAAPLLPSKSDFALARIDPFPYQHKIAEMMLTSPLILPEDCTVSDAALKMKELKKDCVFVGSSADDISGIVSERDLVRCMAMPVSEVSRARDIALGAVMSSPVITVAEQDFMHVALGRISRFDIRHLGVVDSTGQLSGYISSRELNRVRLTRAMVIGDELSEAQNAAEMASAIKGLPMLASSLFSEGVSGYDIAAVISGQYRGALARAATLAEEQLRAEYGPPPCPYTLLMLGSAGRGESLLSADQDHALIYAPSDEGEHQDMQDWFLTLGDRISVLLDEAGIPLCTGGVMSSQPKWCRTSTDWQAQINRWIKRARTEDMLSVDIFFDFLAVSGDLHLIDSLSDLIAQKAPQHPEFLKLLAGNISSHQGGATFFGTPKTVNGRFDIKLHLMLPLVEFMRVLAISRGISARSSTERAAALFATKTVPPEVMRLSEDLQFCIKLLLRQQIEDISAGRPAVSQIEITPLSAHEKQILKSVLGRVGRLEQTLSDCLFSR